MPGQSTLCYIKVVGNLPADEEDQNLKKIIQKASNQTTVIDVKKKDRKKEKKRNKKSNRKKEKNI